MTCGCFLCGFVHPDIYSIPLAEADIVPWLAEDLSDFILIIFNEKDFVVIYQERILHKSSILYLVTCIHNTYNYVQEVFYECLPSLLKCSSNKQIRPQIPIFLAKCEFPVLIYLLDAVVLAASIYSACQISLDENLFLF